MSIQQLIQQVNNGFFLDQTPADIREMVDNKVMSASAAAQRWLGNAPATESQIAEQEKRLGVTLPATYREFLACSNGFGFVSSFLDNLLPVEKIDWARNTEKEWWFAMMEASEEGADSNVIDYDQLDASKNIGAAYFRNALKVAEWYDGMAIFLNPAIQHQGEWEVLEYATWFPGFYRYRSFEDYLHKLIRSSIKLRKMNVIRQMEAYLDIQPEAKRADLQTLHTRILQNHPDCELWYLDGKDDTGKVVSNPNIGYGSRDITYANGKIKPFYRVGLSANTTGISVYILGLSDKSHLANAYGKRLGKASTTGYCIKFKALKDIDLSVLDEAIQYGFDQA